MTQLTGRATIHVDGRRLDMENGAKATPAGVSRTFERHGGRTYALEKEEAPEIEGNVLHTAATDVDALSQITNATVVFECDTGQKYVMAGAAIEGPVPIDASSGKGAIKLVGNTWDKM